MLFAILNIILKIFLLLWLLTLERVIGLPVAFLALSWGWLGNLPKRKIREKYFGLFILSNFLAIVYHLTFGWSATFLILGLGLVSFIKKTLSFKQWQWVLLGVVGATLIALKIDYQWSVWSFVQIFMSSLLILMIKKVVRGQK